MIHADILSRYEVVIEKQGVKWAKCNPDPGTDLAHLRWMLTQLYGEMPADKAGRWLGFIQGCLAMRGLISVSEERNFTRPYFTSAA